MTTSATSYSASGSLSVVASGYWFTAGGEKGSFGYFPHLKNSGQQPVYPDTQLHGSLKMAAGWLLSVDKMPRSVSVESLFGSGGGDEIENPRASIRSRVFVGDLQLPPQSMWPKDKFHVKPRIQINDESRTVDRHFLVDLEMAWFEGETLEAPLHIGPFTTREELEDAIALLKDAATMVSGFGAFRSRGYGRGVVSINLTEDAASGDLPNLESTPQLIALTSLANLRNKPIDPGNAQTLQTDYALSPEQFKGWLATAYHETFKQWPTPLQMSGIAISPLYPSSGSNELALPPPMSTLINEKQRIQDVFGVSSDDVQKCMGEDSENFFASKSKPLGRGWSVTSGGCAIKTESGRRFRNNIDDATFTTTDAGLFSQEYLQAGTVFTGLIGYNGADTLFCTQISHILSTRKPVIKGVPLKVSIGKMSDVSLKRTARLVVSAFPYSSSARGGNCQIEIGTVRTYNAVLKRPRRPKIMVMPGSVVTEDRSEGVLWAGFGAVLEKHVSKSGEGHSPAPIKYEAVQLTSGEKKLTRAQAGQLRQMLHPAMNPAALKVILEHRINKYEQKDNEDSKVILPLLVKILERLNKPVSGYEEMNRYVRSFLDQYAIAQWHINEERQG